METLAPVPPRVREGRLLAGVSAWATSLRSQAPAPVAAPNPSFPRNFRRERWFVMGGLRRGVSAEQPFYLPEAINPAKIYRSGTNRFQIEPRPGFGQRHSRACSS